MENKMRIEAKDGQVLLGNHFHVLKDESSGMFRTTNLAAYVEYVKKFPGEGHNLFYNTDKIDLLPEVVNRHTDALAHCEMHEAELMNEFRRLLGNPMTVDQFEDFLLAFRSCLKESALHILAHVRDLTVAKVTSIKRQKKSNGNFAYSVVRESAGKDNFEPPDQIGFRLPVFDFVDSMLDVDVELFFSYREHGEGVSMTFKLRHFGFEEMLEQAKKDIIEKKIAGLPFAKHYGSFVVTKRDDSWEYQSNGFDGE